MTRSCLFHLIALLAPASAFRLFGRRSSLKLSRGGLLATVVDEDVKTAPSTTTSIPSWDDLKALYEEQTSTTEDAKEVKPVVTLLRDTNGWCPFCERVWLALEIKKIPYQEQLINLQDKPAWFLQMVPTGLVPAVLLHSEQMEEQGDDVSPERSLIWESLDILKALDKHFPNTPRLVQDDNEDYLKAREVASKATTAGVQLLYGARNGTVTEEEKAEKKAAFQQALKELDDFLGSNEKGPFCLGDSVSGVDIEMIPTMERWRYQLPITANITLYDADQFPNIVQWFQALEKYAPYYERVSGDAYSWTAVASTFLRYFATGPNGTMTEQTQQTIDRADAAAQTLTSSFATSSVYEETPASKHQAAAKILSNYDAIVADCTNSDPKSQKELPRASDTVAADAILRAVTHQLLATNEEQIEVDNLVDGEAAAMAAQTVAARLCVPRDMGAPAAQVLRKTLANAAEAFRAKQ